VRFQELGLWNYGGGKAAKGSGQHRRFWVNDCGTGLYGDGGRFRIEVGFVNCWLGCFVN
jgi:hypothetical protein